MPPTDEQRAKDLYAVAAEYETAYWMLSNADKDSNPAQKDLTVPSPKLQILGHELELVMKGWLVLKEGIPENKPKGSQKSTKSLRMYGHDLSLLAQDAVQHYPKLKPLIDDGRIDHLNSSYWGNGTRQYEYPGHQGPIATLTPMDNFARFIAESRADLMAAIVAQNGGTPPPDYTP